jgi:mono/diheme cytochrome c family protein
VRLLLVLAAVAAAVTTSAQELPQGTGREQVAGRCLTCHESDLIAQQRLSPAGWGREVDKMIRWGATVDSSEREAIVAYLAAGFPSARPTNVEVATAAGEQTYKRACLVCHEADLVEAQRLGTPGWTREVDKMIRWGATVSDADKQALVDYLALRFPAR